MTTRGRSHSEPLPRDAADRVVRACAVVEASQAEAWLAWTTPEGVRSFFAPECSIELCVGGRYEILFDPHAQPGERGAEGTRILALQPKEMLSFTWVAPPHLDTIREQRTHVVVRFFPESGGRTKVQLVHDGWGAGDQWDEAYEYFVHAWQAVVFPRLKRRFLEGPINWESKDGPDATPSTQQ